MTELKTPFIEINKGEWVDTTKVTAVVYLKRTSSVDVSVGTEVFAVPVADEKAGLALVETLIERISAARGAWEVSIIVYGRFMKP